MKAQKKLLVAALAALTLGGAAASSSAMAATESGSFSVNVIPALTLTVNDVDFGSLVQADYTGSPETASWTVEVNGGENADYAFTSGQDLTMNPDGTGSVTVEDGDGNSFDVAIADEWNGSPWGAGASTDGTGADVHSVTASINSDLSAQPTGAYSGVAEITAAYAN